MPQQMQKHVGPDGVVHEFPSDASDEEIAAALGELQTDAVSGPQPDRLGAGPGILFGAGLTANQYGPQIVRGATKLAGKAIKSVASFPKTVAAGLGASAGAALTAPMGHPFLGASVGADVGRRFARPLTRPIKAAGEYLSELIKPGISGKGYAIPSKGANAGRVFAGRKMLNVLGKALPVAGQAMMAREGAPLINELLRRYLGTTPEDQEQMAAEIEEYRRGAMGQR